MNIEKLRNIDSIEDLENAGINIQVDIIIRVVGGLIGDIETLKNQVKMQDENIVKLTRLIGDS
jgi:hypothetical protein